jgi:hypothetical protein
MHGEAVADPISFVANIAAVRQDITALRQDITAAHHEIASVREELALAVRHMIVRTASMMAVLLVVLVAIKCFG